MKHRADGEKDGAVLQNKAGDIRAVRETRIHEWIHSVKLSSSADQNVDVLLPCWTPLFTHSTEWCFMSCGRLFDLWIWEHAGGTSGDVFLLTSSIRTLNLGVFPECRRMLLVFIVCVFCVLTKEFNVDNCKPQITSTHETHSNVTSCRSSALERRWKEVLDGSNKHSSHTADWDLTRPEPESSSPRSH